MRQFKPWEWLILQQHYFSRPRRGMEALHSEFLSFGAEEQEQGQKEWAALQSQNIQLIGWQEKNYPKLLKEIYDPPVVLQARGDAETLNDRPWIAVVGTRKASCWGKERTKEIVTSFVKQGCGIISGLAYGIDAAAHQAALDAGGPTWGVLGSSLDRLYPIRHAPLAVQMEKKGGGLLSEFPLGTRAEHYHFPQRNRIISGIAQAVVIIEAAGKSGSLITARYALEQGREVLVAVPPSREDVRYEGNWRLLDDGATPLGIERDRGPWTMDQGLQKEKVHGPNSLLSLLNQPQSVDHLVGKANKTIQELLAELTVLEAKGLVKKLPGALWQSL